jgi:hypothetical protein
VNFDSTISLGNILLLCAFLLSLYAFRRAEKKDSLASNKAQHEENITRLERIETKLSLMQEPYRLMWLWFKKEHGIIDHRDDEREIL